MAAETILQSTIVSKFILPFLLVFFIVFAILEKTKLLGDGQKQLNALLAFVIGLIFTGAVFPKEVVGNLVLFFVCCDNSCFCNPFDLGICWRW